MADLPTSKGAGGIFPYPADIFRRLRRLFYREVSLLRLFFEHKINSHDNTNKGCDVIPPYAFVFEGNEGEHKKYGDRQHLLHDF